jgi:hypothetical protein
MGHYITRKSVPMKQVTVLRRTVDSDHHSGLLGQPCHGVGVELYHTNEVS